VMTTAAGQVIRQIRKTQGRRRRVVALVHRVVVVVVFVFFDAHKTARTRRRMGFVRHFRGRTVISSCRGRLGSTSSICCGRRPRQDKQILQGLEFFGGRPLFRVVNERHGGRVVVYRKYLVTVLVLPCSSWY